MLAVIAAVAVGCDTASDDREAETGETRSVAESVPSVTMPAQLSYAVSLEIRAGRRNVRYTFAAPDPRRHSFEVVLKARANDLLGVEIETLDTTLQVLRSTRDRDWCTVAAANVRCRVLLPALEAQRPGTWTLMVVKKSRPATTADVAIKFDPVG